MKWWIVVLALLFPRTALAEPLVKPGERVWLMGDSNGFFLMHELPQLARQDGVIVEGDPVGGASVFWWTDRAHRKSIWQMNGFHPTSCWLYWVQTRRSSSCTRAGICLPWSSRSIASLPATDSAGSCGLVPRPFRSASCCGMEESGRPRKVHTLEIVGSNPTSATGVKGNLSALIMSAGCPA